MLSTALGSRGAVKVISSCHARSVYHAHFLSPTCTFCLTNFVTHHLPTSTSTYLPHPQTRSPTHPPPSLYVPLPTSSYLFLPLPTSTYLQPLTRSPAHPLTAHPLTRSPAHPLTRSSSHPLTPPTTTCLSLHPHTRTLAWTHWHSILFQIISSERPSKLVELVGRATSNSPCG